MGRAGQGEQLQEPEGRQGWRQLSRGEDQRRRRGNKRHNRGGEEDKEGDDDSNMGMRATERKRKGNNTGNQRWNRGGVPCEGIRQGRECIQKRQVERCGIRGIGDRGGGTTAEGAEWDSATRMATTGGT